LLQLLQLLLQAVDNLQQNQHIIHLTVITLQLRAYKKSQNMNRYDKRLKWPQLLDGESDRGIQHRMFPTCCCCPPEALLATVERLALQLTRLMV
jgi:hypothetical protein